MQQVYLSRIAGHVGKSVTIKGWLQNRRAGGKVQFLLVRDGTGEIQVVVSAADVGQDVVEMVDHLGQESSIVVTGEVKEDKRAPGGYEMTAASIEVVQNAEGYPITPKEHKSPFLLDHRHLWLRSSRQRAILKIRAEVIRALRDFFDSRDFTLLDAPILSGAACEGTTTLFETDYFGNKAYLTQSGQLYQEAGIGAFGKVYCFGPTFRAEKSKTRRHLMEFWMLEPEVAYADLDDIMVLAEDMVASVVARVLETRQKELAVLERDTAMLEKVTTPFPRITYSEAVEHLRTGGLDIEWGKDFGGDEETILAKRFDKPVMVTRYPSALKAFYMSRDPEDEKLALCVDMLAPEGYGEIVGGSQRETSLEELEQRIAEHGLPKDAFQWYLDLRRYGSVPHSGYGIGLERTVSWICGIRHLREAIPFPRLMNRLYP
ncbi:MAG: asparagine--tRNA ligase [Candidatus Eisenbacteria sp.]|nr:asparagine--tRNA ligase [Candidatus Eisenbacteria bacterium]